MQELWAVTECEPVDKLSFLSEVLAWLPACPHDAPCGEWLNGPNESIHGTTEWLDEWNE